MTDGLGQGGKVRARGHCRGVIDGGEENEQSKSGRKGERGKRAHTQIRRRKRRKAKENVLFALHYN